MNTFTRRLQVPGAAGALEVLRDDPDGPTQGVAFLAHPHPLFGGTMDNKVVQTMARAFVQGGWSSVRFNFRGVGGSAGVHDEGRGEADDMRLLVAHFAPEGPIALGGFSFGAFVASQVLASVWDTREVRKIVLVGTAASRFSVSAIPLEAHDRTLVVHGEEDDTVPLQSVLDWARPQALPVSVVPGGGHFFHGQLPLLKSLVARHLRS
ncbi:alpha/beta hydrolase [Ramlibacter algicola]|uniref:Alpha/beta hydrolase n=1 Tax=Ramlibacter algicola TaxID=2795217 RepID=A0A934PWV5_9BURK|nr:alpha/beta hydrolase [Ramlibacter algicola]MBK0391125.1 alpha/beta hydrolase [Ramlibacter algicola]